MRNRLALLSLLLLTFLCTCVSAQSGPTNDDLANAIVFDLPGDLPPSHTVFATQIVNATA